MSGVADVTLIGRVGAQPELKTSGNGRQYATVSVAVSKYRSQGNQYKEDTDWFSATAFGESAEGLSRVAKGSLICIFGRLANSSWTDKQGNERKSLGVSIKSYQLLGAPRIDNGNDTAKRPLDDDEIPF